MINPKQVLSGRKWGHWEEHFITTSKLIQAVGLRGSITYLEVGEQSRPGIVRLQASNLVLGYSLLRSYNNIYLGSDSWELAISFRVASAGSTTEGGVVRLGFMNTQDGTTPPSGIWLEVNLLTSPITAVWVTSTNGVVVRGTNFEVVLNSWVDITIKVNSTIKVQVNGVEQVLLSTPSAALLSSSLGVGVQLIKTLGILTPCTLDLDYMRLGWSLA